MEENDKTGSSTEERFYESQKCSHDKKKERTHQPGGFVQKNRSTIDPELALKGLKDLEEKTQTINLKSALEKQKEYKCLLMKRHLQFKSEYYEEEDMFMFQPTAIQLHQIAMKQRTLLTLKFENEMYELKNRYKLIDKSEAHNIVKLFRHIDHAIYLSEIKAHELKQLQNDEKKRKQELG